MHRSDEVPPIRTRGTSTGELHYHYDRRERESERRNNWSPPGGGFFRRNRALTIVLIDVIIVILLFFIYLFFLRPLEGEARLGEYRLSAQSFLLTEELLVVVSVSRGGETTPDRDDRVSQPIVTVRAGEESASDLAPRPGSERSIALQLSREIVNTGDRITVSVRIGEDARELSIPVSEE